MVEATKGLLGIKLKHSNWTVENAEMERQGHGCSQTRLETADTS